METMGARVGKAELGEKQMNLVKGAERFFWLIVWVFLALIVGYFVLGWVRNNASGNFLGGIAGWIQNRAEPQ